MPNINARLEKINIGTHCEVSTKVALDMHPASLSKVGEILVDGLGGAGEVAYTAARNGKHALHEGLREIVETHEALTEPVDVSMHGKDGGVWKWRVQPERRAEFANAATAKAQSVARTAAQYQSAIEDCINTLSATVDSKLTNPRRDAAAVAGEAPQIRDYVRALPPAERLQFLVTCITDGDFAEVTAVLGASPYSSGLTKKDMAVIRQQAEKRWAPREAAQRDAAIVALEQIKSAQQLFDTKFVAMLPKPDETTKGERALKRLKGEKESA